MATQRPEPGVEYAAFPTEEFRASRSLEARRSLAKFLGVTEYRAQGLLDNPAEYAAELRAHRPQVTVLAARARLRRAWLPGYADPHDWSA